MTNGMTSLILSDPAAPYRSAKLLLSRARLSPALRDAAVKPLSRWLSTQSACLCVDRAGAAATGHNIRRYRLAAGTANSVRRLHLRYLRLAESYAASHADGQVRRAAGKVIRGLLERRASWDQTAQGLAAMRSAVFQSGRRRMRAVQLAPAQSIEVDDGVEWRLVTSVARLQTIGRSASLCTAIGNRHAGLYARQLKAGEMRFYELFDRERGLLGLVSIDPADLVVVEARAAGGGLLCRETHAVLALLAATGASTGLCADLLRIGIAHGFETIDRDRPDRVVGGMDLWRGDGDSILVRFCGWAAFDLDPELEVFVCREGQDKDVAGLFCYLADQLLSAQDVLSGISIVEDGK